MQTCMKIGIIDSLYMPRQQDNRTSGQLDKLRTDFTGSDIRLDYYMPAAAPNMYLMFDTISEFWILD